MAKTATGKGERPLDVEATKAARTRHARGRSVLDAIFAVADPRSLGKMEMARRISQGSGPGGFARFTQAHWTRPGRRARTKAQRIARRANRGR